MGPATPTARAGSESPGLALPQVEVLHRGRRNCAQSPLAGFKASPGRFRVAGPRPTSSGGPPPRPPALQSSLAGFRLQWGSDSDSAASRPACQCRLGCGPRGMGGLRLTTTLRSHIASLSALQPAIPVQAPRPERPPASKNLSLFNASSGYLRVSRTRLPLSAAPTSSEGRVREGGHSAGACACRGGGGLSVGVCRRALACDS